MIIPSVEVRMSLSGLKQVHERMGEIVRVLEDIESLKKDLKGSQFESRIAQLRARLKNLQLAARIIKQGESATEMEQEIAEALLEDEEQQQRKYPANPLTPELLREIENGGTR